MKSILTLILCSNLIISCGQKPNLKEIETTVFGNLPMGVKSDEYNKQFQALAKSSMSVTSGTKYPYFRLDKRDILDYRITFLYPSTFYNHDSLITRIVFYIYQVKFFSTDMVETAKKQGYETRFNRMVKENEERLNFLTTEFNTRQGKVDKQFTYFHPNISQSDDYYTLEKDMIDNIEKKYQKPSSTKVVGDEYDPQDYSFYKEILWKTDKLNIRLLKKRFLVNTNEPSYDFNMVLIYEYNDEVKAKYKLEKDIDLTQTF